MSGPGDTPYLGSRISLISKAKIRYEGILYAIDTENMTVALTKVRSFGTENRDCERHVAAREETFEYIIFRGTDIYDLTVCDLPQDRLPQDPAILNVSQQPAPIGHSQPGYAAAQPPPQPVAPSYAAEAQVEPAAESGAQQHKDRRENQERNQNRNQGNRQNQGNRGQNYNNRNNNENWNQSRTQQTNTRQNEKEKYTEEFDFAAANKEFEEIRDKLDRELKISLGVNNKDGNDSENEENENQEPEELESGEIEEDTNEAYYNKTSSFFDNISCEANDPKGERITRSAERKLNSETFGITANRGYRGGGRGRGRGRGGGGNYRGGGGNYRGRGNFRGGNNYHNNRNSNQENNWRQGHDIRGDQSQQVGEGENNYNSGYNNRRYNNNRNNGQNNQQGGGHWRGNNQGNRSYRGRGNYRNNQGNSDNRNNKRNEWVDYDYDVSKARQKTEA